MLVGFDAGSFRLYVIECFFKRPVVRFHSVRYYDACGPTDAHLAVHQDFRALLSTEFGRGAGGKKKKNYSSRVLKNNMNNDSAFVRCLLGFCDVFIRVVPVF